MKRIVKFFKLINIYNKLRVVKFYNSGEEVSKIEYIWILSGGII